jgi:uncharacterized Zn finger protein (UPF0148 family)
MANKPNEDKKPWICPICKAEVFEPPKGLSDCPICGKKIKIK